MIGISEKKHMDISLEEHWKGTIGGSKDNNQIASGSGMYMIV